MLLAVRPAVIGLLLCTAYDLGSSILRAKDMGWDAALAGWGTHSFTEPGGSQWLFRNC